MTEDKYESLSPYHRAFDAVRDFLPEPPKHVEPPARPERHLYACGEALAEERRAHRETIKELITERTDHDLCREQLAAALTRGDVLLFFGALGWLLLVAGLITGIVL